MAVPQALTDALAKVDTETNNLAAVVTDLRSKIGVGMTQTDVDAVDATLDAISTRLSGIAADPTNPIPAGPGPQMSKAKKKP
jgi:hypothetical protein